ncbi:cytochrome P450 [Deinococcus budaensis]|uniref:Cytochrome P450 n=1 Tax=Deinococcus budaensis TaxID=1665626 RepID=A0A7W8LS14_9DEIO|nr:cytochrome P450 [Deinococcus budaensis]MBB5236210.1 cytochrome P450 [Deinococcus budaensis]
MTAAPRLPGLGALPGPPARRGDGHLGEWARRPLPLLEEGARRAREEGRDLFRLRLGLPAVVGISPAWNRLLLTDLATFRSAGSFPRLVPYLAGGVVVLDAPEHRPRRQALVPAFGPQAMHALRARTAAALEGCPLPHGDFDALAWADRTVRTLLNAAYFSGEFPDPLLHAFLAPLRRPFPVPALPRPLLFGRVDAELRRLARRRGAQGDDLLAVLARLPGGLEEARVSLAAAHDTTTHALAYALWLLAQHPEWHAPEHHPAVLKETLRLFPPGWIGSRRLARDLDHGGVRLPRGALALYSPYLSGRDPGLWSAPEDFRPARWQAKPPAWAYLPFGGGERLCLGLHLAQLLILVVLAAVPPLQAVRGDAAPVAAVTLGPRGPLIVRRRG